MKDSCGVGQELKESGEHRINKKDIVSDPLEDLKGRFLNFKKQTYISWSLHVQTPESALRKSWVLNLAKLLLLGTWQIWSPHIRSFIRDWVSIAKTARLSTEAAVGNLSFETQCAHCEKVVVESINSSLLNLLTYPWIEERVTEGVLSLHGGYYDFTNCSFDKWTLVYRESLEGGSKFAIKNCSTWS
ncbi:Carbonic anhydrase, chloroplastic [Apostasia shenzhenica]|uniref:Carbonic anhydrase n=1 Tax=Apostasia shenzhenica TaxID=1088818 RepID=A0A2I0AIQ3_9ASPA|nr:Carbonic anhydrase, chloroplastic [Apostasia shenzhenica]